MKRMTRLARVATYGCVSTDDRGRVRLRYGRMKLKLQPHEYGVLAAELRVRAVRGRGLEIRYGHGRLRLKPAEFRRFRRMIQSAWSRLVDVQFARLTPTASERTRSQTQPGE